MTVEELSKIQSEIPTEQLVKRGREILSELCKTGARSWSLRVPPDPMNDPDMVFGEIIRRVENQKIKEVALPEPEGMVDTDPITELIEQWFEKYIDREESPLLKHAVMEDRDNLILRVNGLVESRKTQEP